jgi:hypothetical protein
VNDSGNLSERRPANYSLSNGNGLLAVANVSALLCINAILMTYRARFSNTNNVIAFTLVTSVVRDFG